MESVTSDPNDKLRLKQLVEEFAALEGRQPRAMVSSSLPLAGDERNEETAVFLSDLGFNVDVGPYFHSERELVSNATENDVDILILSKVNQLNQTDFMAKLKDVLREKGRSDLIVIPMSSDPTTTPLSASDLSRKLETALSHLLR
jgi:methylmalonyl-CoA mutase